MAIHLKAHARVPGIWLTNYIPKPIKVICLKDKIRNLEICVKIYCCIPLKITTWLIRHNTFHSQDTYLYPTINWCCSGHAYENTSNLNGSSHRINSAIKLGNQDEDQNLAYVKPTKFFNHQVIWKSSTILGT